METSDDLSKCTQQEARYEEDKGCKVCVPEQWGRGDLTYLKEVGHLAQRLLRQYQQHGAPVVLSGRIWTETNHKLALEQGPH